MTIRGVLFDHVAVAAEDQHQLWPRYVGDLGGRWIGGGGTVGFFSAQVSYANAMRLEVLEPYQVERNDFLRRFLDRNGPGPHHLTFKVPDLGAALEEADGAGYSPVGVDMSDPGWQEAFLHPKDAPGIVVQLARSSHEGEWSSPPPAEVATLPTGPSAALIHVAHALGRPADGTRLFAGLLGGEQVAAGAGWLDLDWPGGNRVRLLDASGSGPLADWVGSRPGRLHHLGFLCEEPGTIAGAKPTADDGLWTVEPEENLGVRLLLTSDPDLFQQGRLGY